MSYSLCHAPECANQALPVNESFCKKHRCLKCSAPNMYVFAPVPPKEGYCGEHKCRNDSCENANTNNGSWCQAHTCSSGGCLAPKITEQWCVNHACYYQGCSLPKTECFKHQCKAKKCEQRASAPFRYCKRHVCSFEGCSDLAKQSKWCFRHQCGGNSGTCYERVVDDKRLACEKHLCSAEGCKERSQEKFPTGLCFDHSCFICGKVYDDGKCSRCKNKCMVSGCQNPVFGRKQMPYDTLIAEGFCTEHFCVVCTDLSKGECDQHSITSVMKAYNKKFSLMRQ